MRFGSFCVWVMGIILFVHPASAQNKRAAKKKFSAAMKLVQQGDCAAAIPYFEEVLALYPSNNAQYNMAACYQQTEQYIVAYRQFTAILKKEDLDEKMRVDVERRLAALREYVVAVNLVVDVDGAQIRIDDVDYGTSPLSAPLLLSRQASQLSVVREQYQPHRQTLDLTQGNEHTITVQLSPAAATLEIEANVAGANVVLDGRVVGRTPLAEPLRLAPGQYTVTVKHEQYPARAKSVLLGPGEEKLLSFTLEAAPSMALVDDSAPATSKTQKRLRTVGWIASGAGVATLVAGGISGGVALKKQDELRDLCPDITCTGKKNVEKNQDYEAVKNAADILFAVGGAVAATGVTLLILSYTSSFGEKEQRVVAPIFDSRTAGVTFQTSF